MHSPTDLYQEAQAYADALNELLPGERTYADGLAIQHTGEARVSVPVSALLKLGVLL
jgi:hypothetical protein